MILEKENRKRIEAVCKTHFVDKLFVFGSFASNEMKKDSDVDILVKFVEMDLYNYFDNLLSLKENLESVFKRPVDILEEQAVKNPYLKRSIDRNRILIYGRENSQMAS